MTTSSPSLAPAQVCAQLLELAQQQGATAADVLLASGTETSVQVRAQQPEQVERAASQSLGLRVLVGQQQAIVSGNDFRPAALQELASRAVAMAKLAPPDPYAGLASLPPAALRPAPDGENIPALDTAALLDICRTGEGAARAVPGVTNTERCSASSSQSQMWLATSQGFFGTRTRTHHTLAITAIAGSGTQLERDYEFDIAEAAGDLRAAAEVGQRAGARAVARCGARKVASTTVPVVFEARVAGSLLGHLADAINGQSICRQTSFLQNSLGQTILHPMLDVHDDPHLPQGLRRQTFDAEGMPTAPRTLVARGVLQSWILDSRSARQLGMSSTAHASRGPGGSPSPAPSNLYLANGPASVPQLLSDIKNGFYVTEMMGFGVNLITGDYSRGATGFWIENGQLSYPVAEVTIAGNLRDMFLNLSAANDLEFRHAINSPTVRVAAMTLAGR